MILALARAVLDSCLKNTYGTTQDSVIFLQKMQTETFCNRVML